MKARRIRAFGAPLPCRHTPGFTSIQPIGDMS